MLCRRLLILQHNAFHTCLIPYSILVDSAIPILYSVLPHLPIPSELHCWSCIIFLGSLSSWTVNILIVCQKRPGRKLYKAGQSSLLQQDMKAWTCVQFWNLCYWAAIMTYCIPLICNYTLTGTVNLVPYPFSRTKCTISVSNIVPVTLQNKVKCGI